MNARAFLVAAALGSAMLLASAGTAEAHYDRYDRFDRNCARKISREEDRLRRDIRRHGPFSRQARNRRARIAQLYRQCGARGYGYGRNDRRGRGGRGIRGAVRDQRRGAILLPNGRHVVLPPASRRSQRGRW
jgi:hypothetical protein